MTVMDYDMGHTIEPAKLVTADEMKILEQKLRIIISLIVL